MRKNMCDIYGLLLKYSERMEKCYIPEHLIKK